MVNTKNKFNTQKMTLTAILTAFVVVFEMLSYFLLKPGLTFNATIALVPIVVGAAICGIGYGSWLGFIFGLVVLLEGGAAFFLEYNPYATVLVVLLKGTLCGAAAGVVFKLTSKFNKYVGTILSGLICSVVNTGIVVLGGIIFFLPRIEEISRGTAYPDALVYMFMVMIGINIIIELGINMVLCPLIVRIIGVGKKQFKK